MHESLLEKGSLSSAHWASASLENPLASHFPGKVPEVLVFVSWVFTRSWKHTREG